MNKAILFGTLFAMGLMWGLSVPLAKIAVSTGHHAFGLVFWQFVVMAVLLSIIALVRRSKLIWDKQNFVFFLIICVTGTLIPNSTGFIAAFHLPGGVMALIIAMVPVFSLMIALGLKVEKFQPIRLIGIVVGMLAIGLIVLPESSLPDPAKAVFVLVALIAPFCYGVEGNYLALKSPPNVGPVATLFGASLLGALLSAPLALGAGVFINPLNGVGPPELALIGSASLHVVAYTCYIWVVGKAGAVFTAQVGYIVTPAGVLFSIAFLDETPSPYIWLAMVMLLFAIGMVQPRNKI